MGKIDNIKTLLQLNGAAKSYEDSAITIINAIKHLVPDFKDENVKPEDIKDIIESVQDEIIPIYDKYFNDEEIMGIIEFYKTQLGKIYLAKMGTVALECMQVGNKNGELIYNRLMKLSAERNKE